MAAALIAGGTATAALEPLPRAVGDEAFPRVRPAPTIPPRTGRTRVIVGLTLPPLAQAVHARMLSGRSAASSRLDVRSLESRSYLARLDLAQQQAITAIERAIPGASVSRRFRIVLNGLTVSVPTRDLPELARLGFVRKLYPSYRYTLNTNRGPSMIMAPQLRAAAGIRGEGIKVAVVDDGVDPRTPFLAPAGLTPPPGFPRGDNEFTSAKVIVARAFAALSAGADARELLDLRRSFHGTHVAGIIAGNENTTAPSSTVLNEEQTARVCIRRAGGCIPRVSGLTGVAPRAWIGNYRVFNVPNPLDTTDCCSGSTPEIVAAFEAAVADGMDVLNFSGGGPQADPATDALIPAVANVARAGVVPVISAGNDRDLFGLGSLGSPSTAPEAISVAAVTNAHTFAPALSLVSSGAPDVQQVAFVAAPGAIPQLWSTTPQPIVDVASVGADTRLCTAPPTRSLVNAIAVVTRGGCTYELKSAHAAEAGAIGVVVIDDHPGEASGIPIRLARPAGMVADLDGARLRAELAKTGGRGSVRIGIDVLEVDTGRGGTPASFSAGGLTSFGHELRPDISAPGAGILSSTVPDFAGADYAVLDGTSFSAPHVAGAAALLAQRFPGWTPAQVKSALMTTAGPAWADTARTVEAPVYLQGAGLVRLTEAIAPRIFTDPQSLSFRDLNVNAGAQSRTILVQVSDAGGGGATWQVEIRPQVASAGASISAPGSISVPPGGSATFPVTASAGAGASPGDDFGFVILRDGNTTRRIPYGFVVTRPRLAGAPSIPLQTTQAGDTRQGVNRAEVYRWPTNPFGLASFLGVDVPVEQHGPEQVFHVDVTSRVANIGVTIVDPPYNTRASFEDLLIAPIHPWLLGSLDENDVQGYAGTPINLNGYTAGYLLDNRTAGTAFPRPGRYYVSVDSGTDPFGPEYSGPYTLRSWINDVTPPRVQLLTTQVASGRPTIAFRATDTQSGIDPFTPAIIHEFLLVAASHYDPATGIVVVPFPREAGRLRAGRTSIRLIASDLQESKNVNSESNDPMPNTARRRVSLRVVNRATVTWLNPSQNACVTGSTALEVVASSPATISSVGFYDGGRQIARVRRTSAGIFTATWNAGAARKGVHRLAAVVSDVAGREARATRRVRVC